MFGLDALGATPEIAVAQAALPLAEKLTSQEIILAALVLLVSASLFIVSLRFTYTILIKRDEVIKELANELKNLSICINKVADIQSVDHSATIKNRDILQDQGILLSALPQIVQSIKELNNELREHAKDCSRKLNIGIKELPK
jgi:hypothetical protein